ncbi:hypothetical protein GCM10011410_17730 [Hoyosella rhizosphaerae]|uniref:Uncharacterized protein n=1 Tax=Hoyosella rhizosphaerae TaxID=1755582 RepID=A0A916XDJ6_9ACTN|nr:hypothetical protein GCM10011410_17730 [Hoyosella rhizosphaerae]
MSFVAACSSDNNDEGSVEASLEQQSLYNQVCADLNQSLAEMQIVHDQEGLGPVNRTEVADEFLQYMRDPTDWVEEWNATFDDDRMHLNADELAQWDELTTSERDTIERATQDAAAGRC